MKVIILAAGRGSRMKEGTAQVPKCMMQLWGRTLLDMCLESLECAGISRSDIGIVTGYRREKITVEGVRYFHNPDWESTNMFISLTMAEEWLQHEPCIVCYSDIVFHPDAIRQLVFCQKELAITYYTGFLELWQKRFANPLDDLETFQVSREGILIEIGHRPQSFEEVQGQYMGLLHFEPSGWAKVRQAICLPMEKPVERLDLTTLLHHLLLQGHEIYAIPTDELWLECDNQEDIALYEKEYAL